MLEFLGRNICKFLSISCQQKSEKYWIKIRNVTFRFELRFERWWNLLFEKGIPIYSFKKRMSFEFSGIILSSKPVSWITIKKLNQTKKRKLYTPLTKDLPSAERVSLGNRTFPNAIFLYICWVSS